MVKTFLNPRAYVVFYKFSGKMPSGCTTARRAHWIRSAGKSWATCASTTRWPRHPSTCSGTRVFRSVPTAWYTGCARSCSILCPPSSWTSCYVSRGPNLCTYLYRTYNKGTQTYIRTFTGKKFPKCQKWRKVKILNKNEGLWINLSRLTRTICADVQSL